MDVSGLFSFEINVNILMRQSVAARGNDRTRPQLVSWRSCFHDVDVDNINVSSYHAFCQHHASSLLQINVKANIEVYPTSISCRERHKAVDIRYPQLR